MFSTSCPLYLLTMLVQVPQGELLPIDHSSLPINEHAEEGIPLRGERRCGLMDVLCFGRSQNLRRFYGEARAAG